MPAPKPPPSSGISNFLKGNAKFAYGGGVGLAFLGLDLKNVLDSDNKFKALLKTLKDFVLIRVAMVGLFNAVQAGIRGLVRDTGSLDQALKKLGQMQTFSRQLSAFVGGLSAARQRISALSQLSAKSPFKFEELAQANKSLEVFTRGAYSSVEATKEIGMVALATGNNITDVASVVGSFYDNLKNGQPVAQTTEQLRQMGVISQTTADHLNGMVEGGSNATQVFGELTEAMKKTAQGADGYKSELASITEEHQKAIESLQEKFASPFTAQETKNIENMTDAMKAITPTIGKVAGSLAIVFGGFTTAKTSMAKFFAESKSGQKTVEVFTYAIEALSVAAAAFGIYAAGQLTPIIAKLGQNFVQMGGFAAGATVALRSLAIVGVWALVATAVVSVVGAVINYSASIRQLKKDFRDWSTAQADNTAKLREQAAAIVTLADKHAVLASAMKNIIALQKQQDALDDKRKHRSKDEETPVYKKDMRQLIAYFSGAEEREKKLDEKKDKRASKEIENNKKIMADAAAQSTIIKEIVDAEAERQLAIEKQTKGIEQRDREAKAGLDAQQAAEKPLGDLEKQRVEVAGDLEKTRGAFKEREKELPKKPILSTTSITGGSEAEIRKYDAAMEQYRKKEEEFNKAQDKHYLTLESKEKALIQIDKEKQNIALQGPKTSSLFLNAQAEQLRQAKELKAAEADYAKLQKEGGGDREALSAAQIRVERAKALAGPEGIQKFAAGGELGLRQAEIAAATAKKAEANRPSPEELRQQRVERFQIKTDIQGRGARTSGDIKGAQAFEDLSKFSHHAEELMASGFQKQEAIALAGEQTRADITDEYLGKPMPVSALTAIGGGGGLPGIDPATEIARRQEMLQQKMVEYLALLSGKEEPETQTQPVYQ